jgi:hypothetical protein
VVLARFRAPARCAVKAEPSASVTFLKLDIMVIPPLLRPAIGAALLFG